MRNRSCKCLIVLVAVQAVNAQLKDADLYLNAVPASTGECLRKVPSQIALQTHLLQIQLANSSVNTQTLQFLF